MNVFTDLRAGTHGRPGIDHAAFVDVSTDIDVRGHQNGIACDIGALAHRRRRHDAEASRFKARFVPAGKFHRHFVIKAGFRAFHNLVVVNAERQQNCLLQPLMRYPLTLDFFRYAQRAAVQLRDDLVDGFTGYGVYARRGNLGAALEGRFNNAL